MLVLQKLTRISCRKKSIFLFLKRVRTKCFSPNVKKDLSLHSCDTNNLGLFETRPNLFTTVVGITNMNVSHQVSTRFEVLHMAHSC